MVLVEELDQEWIDLIAKARELGMKVDDIRNFLQLPSHEE
ncbi:anti-repressor SinI family protein [Ammoniphilus resinae]|uniref:DNA-binding transcriptional MerR regulator n=1 Tax=Ammoniphilus resinae TaxID=861532 RepID=A0ABS4GXN7_9BACL|nr:anti-repressor SinI family protein [Ammoniphilus resinae]MBP1935045.1 DNA-binding transcriptional MerR regulator [Ammoniphilus resinae]